MLFFLVFFAVSVVLPAGERPESIFSVLFAVSVSPSFFRAGKLGARGKGGENWEFILVLFVVFVVVVLVLPAGKLPYFANTV